MNLSIFGGSGVTGPLVFWVLTSQLKFAFILDETDNEYYSIEAKVGQKVAAMLEGSPGIRIGVNGQVLAQSMKVEKSPKKFVILAVLRRSVLRVAGPISAA